MSEHAAKIQLVCSDLEAALAFYTGEAGFRLDMIVPADAPRLARLSGHGLELYLEQRGERVAERTPASGGQGWVIGRAGMHYRDLVPGRAGGRLVASHIRIPDGGPVPDYVHYHRVGFQMIYCRRGWVRVVYEDQGPPFVMHEGDCVLQPPGIRHRVLEASPGLEVIELSVPAEHETWRDHDLELPNGEVRPGRLFDGQRFLRHVASEATWDAVDMSGVLVRDTGIEEATGGVASARVLHIDAGETSFRTRSTSGGLRFLYVLGGEPWLQSGTAPAHALAPDDACLVAADGGHVLIAKTPADLLEVCLPAR